MSYFVFTLELAINHLARKKIPALVCFQGPSQPEVSSKPVKQKPEM